MQEQDTQQVSGPTGPGQDTAAVKRLVLEELKDEFPIALFARRT